MPKPNKHKKILIHRMNVLKQVINYFWAFWLYLFLWMIATMLVLYGFILVAEWMYPLQSNDSSTYPLSNELLYLLLYISSASFVIFLFLIIQKKQKRYTGLVLNLINEEDESDYANVYRHYVLLHCENEKHKIRLDNKAFSKLKVGMRIEMRYDDLITDAKLIHKIE